MDWMLRKPEGQHSMHVYVDVNKWKTRARDRLSTDIGAPGSVTVFGADARGKRLSAGTHNMLFEHWTAEKSEVFTGARSGAVELWSNKFKRENHWWDCFYGCMVGASMERCAPPGLKGLPERRRMKSWSEVRNAKRSVNA